MERTDQCTQEGMTIVIPSYQRRDSLLRLLESLGKAIEPTDDIEVIVILDGSTDGSDVALDDIRMGCAFRYHWQENAGRAAARNAGVAMAQGKICWLIDDDMTFHREALVAHLNFHLSTSEPSVLMGPQWEQKVKGRLAEYFSDRINRLAEAKVVTDPFDFWSGNFSIPRETLLKIDGFNNNFVGWGEEDTELGFRLLKNTIPVIFEATAGGYHWRIRRMSDQIREERERGRNLVRLCETHPEAIDHEFFPPSPIVSLYRRKIRMPWFYGMIARSTEILLQNGLFGWLPFQQQVLGLGMSAARLAGVLDAGGSECLQRALVLQRPLRKESKTASGAGQTDSAGYFNPVRMEYESTGMLKSCRPLADTSVLPEVIADASFFKEAVAKLKAGRKHRVPYAFTPAIRALACDDEITRVVRHIFGNDEWVAWGANIQLGTPNAAHHWHNDIESVYWPSITVAVGLRGCKNNNATQYIPGSHRFSCAPDMSGDPSNTGLVLAAAQKVDPACGSVVRFSGFCDGSFAVFDARGWHCGDTEASVDRLVLFLHYQRAGEPRIPYMRDFTRNTWFPEAAAFMPNPSLGDRYESAVYPPPARWGNLAYRLMKFVKRQVRAAKPFKS